MVSGELWTLQGSLLRCRLPVPGGQTEEESVQVECMRRGVETGRRLDTEIAGHVPEIVCLCAVSELWG